MSVQLTITGANAVEAANELRMFVAAMQLAANGTVASKDAAKPAKTTKPESDEDEEEELPAKKTAAKKPVKKAQVEEDDEDDTAPAAKPKPKAKAKPAQNDEEEDEQEAPKKKATDGKSSVGELKDDGLDQPPTVDGCRIMVRRVARAHDTSYAQAVLAEFGVEGATKVPPKKMAAFIERCQEVIDEPESIEIDQA